MELPQRPSPGDRHAGWRGSISLSVITRRGGEMTEDVKRFVWNFASCPGCGRDGIVNPPVPGMCLGLRSAAPDKRVRRLSHASAVRRSGRSRRMSQEKRPVRRVQATAARIPAALFRGKSLQPFLRVASNEIHENGKLVKMGT
jgi:hypothetical protein